MARKKNLYRWRIAYHENKDAFSIESSCDDGESWSMKIYQPCKDGELISYEFLTQIRHLIDLGFQQSFYHVYKDE